MQGPSDRNRNDQALSLQHLAIAVGAIALLFGSMWIAVHKGIQPELSGKFLGIISILIESLPVLLILWLSAAGLGGLVKRWLLPEAEYGLVLQLGIGLAAVLWLSWMVGLLGFVNRYVAWLICLPGASVVVWQLAPVAKRRALEPLNWPNPPWTLLLGLPASGLLLVACCCPPGTLWSVEAFGYDVTSYHLQLPREWLEAGAIRGLQHNVYSFLPNFVEAGYMQIGAMHGSIYAGIYTTQLFHATTAILAAVALACVVSRWVGAVSGVLAGVSILALPWVMITGSLPYNEMVVMALGATALLVLFDPAGQNWRATLCVGLLIGAATMAKLTAGPMIAAPIVLLMLIRPSLVGRFGSAPKCRVTVRSAGVACLGVAILLGPYFLRNAAWTGGNPIFPFATSQFGSGHWDHSLVERWNRAHESRASPGESVSQVVRQWLCNTGYGGFGGVPRLRNAREVASFDRENGLPIFLGGAFVTTVLVMRWRMGRPIAVAAIIMLAVQLLFWVWATHQQSRFLIPTILPLGVLVGVGAGRLIHLTRQRFRWAFAVFSILLVGLCTLSSFEVFFAQTLPGLPPWRLVDSLARPRDLPSGSTQPVHFGHHPLNELPPTSHTYMVADAGRLLYIRNRVKYHTAFDASFLGEHLRQHQGNAAAVTSALRRLGITHVWVNWSELNRLRTTYGYDAAVNRESLLRLSVSAQWRVVRDIESGRATLFALP